MCSLTKSDVIVDSTGMDNTTNWDHEDGFAILDKTNVIAKPDSYLTCHNSKSIEKILRYWIIWINLDHSDEFTILDKINVYAKVDSNRTFRNFR